MYNNGYQGRQVVCYRDTKIIRSELINVLMGNLSITAYFDGKMVVS